MESTDLKPAEFSCHALNAQTVFVAGTFNDWNPTTVPLDRQANGPWKTTLPFPAGHHEFKFIVDGQWCCEHEYQGCPKCCTNELGAMNRVLKVS